jgi:hypothetical protein
LPKILQVAAWPNGNSSSGPTFVLGRRPDVPSALPLDYGTGLLVTLAAVWLGVATVAVVRELTRRRRAGGP